MKFECFMLCVCCCVAGIRSFILIPEELPSILSIFYSNIPSIKKGTDSRVGIGLRLGPNADFQVQLELGPQLNTLPLGPNNNSSTVVSKKRQTNSSPRKRYSYNATNPSEKWLNTWKLNLNEDENQQLSQDMSHINDPSKENFSFVNHLRQLYHSSSNNTT